jgi:hypothetical protein
MIEYAHVHYQNNNTFYDTVLTFLDVQGSPLSYLFTFHVQQDDRIVQPRSWYNKVKQQKRDIKEELRNENSLLEQAEQSTTANVQEMYEQKFQVIETLKHELDQLRLQGDDFLIDIKGVIHVLNVGQDGFVYIYVLDDNSTIESIVSRERQVYDNCTTRKWMIQVEEIRSIKKIENTYKGDGLEAMSIQIAEPIVFYALDRYEMLETVGAFVQRSKYSQNKLRTYLRDGLLPLRDEKYDSNNDQHEKLLLKLWTQAFPDIELTGRKSDQWVQLGFQGVDPATDFRSMGMLGLHHLLYATDRYYTIVRSILDQDRQYPFAVAMINVSHTLLGIMGITQRVSGQSMNEMVLDSELFIFLCSQMHLVEYPYEELVFLTCELLDMVWVRDNGSYMRFGEILKTSIDMLKQALSNKPISFDHLKSMVGLIK